MAEDPQKPGSSRGSKRGGVWARITAFVFAFVFFAFSFAEPASAHTGEASGWSLEDASEELQIGKIRFTYDPDLADEAGELSEEMPRYWAEIEEALTGDVDDEITIHFVEHAGWWRERPECPTGFRA